MKINLKFIYAEEKGVQITRFREGYKKYTGVLKAVAYIGYLGIRIVLPLCVMVRVSFIKDRNTQKPQLYNLSLLADNLPVSWGKIVKTSAADYEDRIHELWGARKYKSAKWNQKLAWLCALSNLGHYLWLKAWKPVSTVFRRLL